ncbi:MAG: hypothetical protein HUK20_03615, partial [Fibrobacter sp.]|nr:hypothetical protein [Bacteroidales bacterium]MCF0223332.1 hypothetical protein [Fibrobacter sp.]
TEVQLEKCWDMLAWWYDYKQFDPTSVASIINQAGDLTFERYRISGHRDVKQDAYGNIGTTCPGTTLHSMLPNFRVQVARRMNDCGWDITIPGNDSEPPTCEIDAEGWHNSNFSVSFDDSNNSSMAFYQIVDNNNGLWSSNTGKAMLYEQFDAEGIPSCWTNAAGSWQTNEGSVLQTDEELSGTNLHCDLYQERGLSYLYHLKMKISGEGSNRRAGFYFFADNADRQNGYMVFLRADQNTAQLYKYVNGSYTENGGVYTSMSCNVNPDQWYDVKVVFNSQTGAIRCYVDDVLAVSLNDTNPFSVGNCFSLRTANCVVEYKDIYVCRSRNVDGNVSLSLGENGDIRYESVAGEPA